MLCTVYSEYLTNVTKCPSRKSSFDCFSDVFLFFVLFCIGSFILKASVVAASFGDGGDDETLFNVQTDKTSCELFTKSGTS